MMLKNLKLDMCLNSEVKFASFSFKFPSSSELMYMKEKKSFSLVIMCIDKVFMFIGSELRIFKFECSFLLCLLPIFLLRTSVLYKM